MKSLSLFALAMLSVAGTAQAAPPVAPEGAGWFYDVSAGGLWLQDFDVSSGVKGNFDTGFGANLELGYHLGNGLGFGVDLGYYHADFGSVQGFGQNIDINGDIKLVPILGNLHYDVKLGGGFSLNLAAGIGGVYQSTSVSGVGSANVSASEDSWELGFQGLAGFSYHISDGVSLGVGYRYINVGGADVEGHMIQGSLNFRW